MKITIVMACDEPYAMPLATALRSMVEAKREGNILDVHVLTSHFSPMMRQKVLNSLPQDSASLHWIPVDLAPFKRFAPPPSMTWLSQMTYARLLLPQFFAKNVSRILYLDADILVLSDLGPLLETDLEGAALGAATDINSEADAARLGLITGCEYFNAGVLLIDLVQWREQHISEEAMDYMVRNPRASLGDQDALNVACGGRWRKLDVRWNLIDHQPCGYSKMRSQQWPFIAHFAGHAKPWNPKKPNVNARFYECYRARTQFARTTSETIHNAAQTYWALVKRFLKGYKFISQIHRYVARPKAADGAESRA